MFQARNLFGQRYVARYLCAFFSTVTKRLRIVLDLGKTVAAASGVDVCSEEPPYHAAEELWEELKHGDEGARWLFVFFLRLRKIERTRCSVEKAIAAEGKRWVGILIEEAWRPYLPMRHRAVPYQGKPMSVVAIEGSRVQLRILARSGLAPYSAPSVKERAAVQLQTTWNKIHQQWVVLWMDTWYNEQFTTNPDKNNKSLNATAWLSCSYGMHHATGMVILALKSWNSVFLLLRACWRTVREPFPVSCLI